MDAGSRQELNSIIEKLTHSGLPSLNQELLKRLKRLCKSSDACIRATHETVMSHLAKNHAEIRFSAFQIIDDLFQRSHLFRELILSEFQRFTQLVTGTDPKQPLPLPKTVASKLKEKSLLAIRQWHDKFGEGYPRLKLSYNYLKCNKKVNFDELVAQSEAVRRRQQEREARQAAMLQQRVRDIKQEMNDMRLDIEDCLAQVESCFNLLVPRFDVPDIYSSAESQESSCELSPPSHQHKEHVITEKGEGKERKRKRTISSCSFVSLSSGEESNDDEQEPGQPVHTSANPKSKVEGDVLEQEAFSSVHTTSREEVKKEDSTIRDEDILARLFTSSSGNGSGLKLGAAASSGSGKGKGKLKDVVVETKLREEDDSGDSSDSSSNVEWEEVPVSELASSESHDQAALLTDLQEHGLMSQGFGIESHDQAADLQEHGLMSRGFSIPITIELSKQPEVTETEDNTSIIATLQECKQLLAEKYLPAINKWMEWMTKAGGEGENLRKAIDFKNKIMTTLNKFQRLKVVYTIPPSPKRPHQDNTEEQPAKPTPKLKSHSTPSEWQFGGSYSSVSNSDIENDPTTPEAQLARLKKKLSAKRRNGTSSQSEKTAAQDGTKGKSTAAAPVVPFGMDLYYWDKPKDVEPMTLASVGSLHRFWVEEREISISEEEKARLRCRAITYVGEFEPVQRSCRAPLPNGSLCPRKDRIKCPFHGVIIPRDEHGNPVKTSSEPQTSSGLGLDLSHLEELNGVQSSSREAGELWRDIQLQTDIMAAATLKPGLQQEGAKKGKGRRVERKKKYPGLTDLKVHTDTPRQRLEKKVLNKRSLKRVAELQEKAAAKQYQDKFGYNFNYALKS